MTGCREAGASRPGCWGAVLLEVVLALGLFAAAALITLVSLNACVEAARQVRLEAQAADLAVTLLSEVRMGLVALRDTEPEPCPEPYEGWTWRLRAAPIDEPDAPWRASRAEVEVTHAESGYTLRLAALVAEEIGLQGGRPTVRAGW